MPETPFTEYCGHMYRLLQRLHDFIMGAVAPGIDSQLAHRPESARKRANAIQVTFVRIFRWLKTLDKLNQTHDVQAVGAAARGVFELYLDLRWFEKFPEPEYLERFCAFPDVTMYMAAKKVVEHKRQNPTSSVNSDPQQSFMDRMDKPEPMSAKVSRLWGVDQKGKPLWPRDHWAGKGKLPQRTKLLGLDCEDAYVQIYSILCGLIHPGASPEVRQSLSDFEWLEKQMGYALFHVYMHARASTILACDLLGAREQIAGFDRGLRQLDAYLDDAARSLPGFGQS